TASCEPAEIRVWDGDSIRLGMGQQSEAVRIFNIDAPEMEGLSVAAYRFHRQIDCPAVRTPKSAQPGGPVV
ncbi:MAG: hypothetical protein WCZ84_12205, partial [Castellaniella sp.]